ncbi:recQ-mediated genome instability protein 1 [Taeniopygia guttata]|uniref:RecQ-mediated genome instability protein 1 n=1 Tax=Taeniopygia guttata TaxID=59729 RepID=H0YY49_TAEGU|nr:recQ-mediated genome instability protein 1 [Taeniopygia guttata]XP_030114857.1 recQ-mediated genome instability protein 1 [Taeniopygia guttata]XP_030114858.1 recQ-mediated genome instability protein 1 [Taeniopygia guttata]XP_030114859.1 recQ-mediated genome instability protein 1 [Taeniopygia guttata]XP_030114861.1 recQ-mediated genome instability protein 1 [Taeniopygia guttata]
MSTSSIVARVETWLSSTWHVKVPLTWLEACINWIQEENNGSNLSQAQINKQVFEQWLLTDLRDLEYPILPNCVLNTPRGELSGCFSIQIDSLVDVSQPAYSQLQKLRGKSTVNEEVTASTQAFQKPWEAKPTRMLMLQLTDGIHQIQGMEYQPVPVLCSNLPPGTKITVQGNIAYRLGVLLLKPENVKLLGGEVDALLEDYCQERVLARLIGEAENPNSVGRAGHEQIFSRPVDELEQILAPSDEELLASLDENNEFTLNNRTSLESGYCTRSNNFNTASGSLPAHNGSVLLQKSGSPLPHSDEVSPPIGYADGFLNDFPLEDDFLLEEEMQREMEEVPPVEMNRNITVRLPHTSTSSCNSSLHGTGEEDNENERDKPREAISEEKNMRRAISGEDRNSMSNFLLHKGLRQTCSSSASSLENPPEEGQNYTDLDESRCKHQHISNSRVLNDDLVFSLKMDPEGDQQKCDSQIFPCKAVEAHLDLDSPPFTYISLLLAKKPETVTILKVKCFIVTLTGNLTKSNGSWGIKAKISDGSAYLEVDFADDILTSFIGFSVPEINKLKKDPALRLKLKDGLEKCQKQLIDLCCLMTIEFNPFQSKATVLILQDADARHLEQLKKRLNK